MHPAFSVIFFTTLSGAGYGLLTGLFAQAPGGKLTGKMRLAQALRSRQQQGMRQALLLTEMTE